MPDRRSTATSGAPGRTSARFAELAWAETAMGEISLRRRRDPTVGVDVYEVKLGDEYLMSSLFTVAEVELARRGLAAAAGSSLDLVVGGLGLGYTARAALADHRVASLVVVEALADVVDWHRRGLLPEAEVLSGDPRTRLVTADFFALAASAGGLDPDSPGRRFDAVLLDVDHSPRHLLHPAHAPFYTAAGLRGLTRHLAPGGVFAMWSDGLPDSDFHAVLGRVFADVTAHVVTFANPLTGGESASTVYVAA